MTHAIGHLGVRLEKIGFQVGNLFDVPGDREGRFDMPSLEEIRIEASRAEASMTAWQHAHPPTTRYGQRVARRRNGGWMMIWWLEMEKKLFTCKEGKRREKTRSLRGEERRRKK